MTSEEEGSKGIENSAQSSLSSERKVFLFFFFFLVSVKQLIPEHICPRTLCDSTKHGKDHDSQHNEKAPHRYKGTRKTGSVTLIQTTLLP